MPAEDRAAPVEQPLGVLDVDVVDAVGEVDREGGRVEELVGEVARVEVDAEARARRPIASSALRVVTKS